MTTRGAPVNLAKIVFSAIENWFVMASSVAEKLAGVRVANGEGWASVAPNLRKNLGVLSSEEVSVSSKLHPIPCRD
ncbi:hypothetical protein BHE74_00025012 [Ensete ventricosum]|nr:hypothetical protein BHE74_00025012 [Ensete ventricosum]